MKNPNWQKADQPTYKRDRRVGLESVTRIRYHATLRQHLNCRTDDTVKYAMLSPFPKACQDKLKQSTLTPFALC